MLPSWAGWLGLAAGILVIISSALSHGTPPFLIYLLATLPLGIAAAVRRWRMSGERAGPREVRSPSQSCGTQAR